MAKVSPERSASICKCSPSRMDYLLVAFIAIAVFVAYWPAVHGEFIWDDEEYVSGNELLTAPDGLRRIWLSTDAPSQYFPLVYTTFRIERAIWGLDTTGYHVTNIVLHILNALLVWLILRKLSVRGAWLAAAVFALHPVHVESVAWITERKNVLSTFFYLLTVLSWMKFRDRSDWRFYVLAVLASALALFAKTTACTIPAALLLVSWFRRERIGLREWGLMMPFAALGTAMGLTSIWWEKNKQGTTGEDFDFTMPERVLIASRALWFYIGKLVWPARLAFSYSRWEINSSQPIQYLWSACWVSVAAVLWRSRRMVGRGPIAALVFFVAALVPMIGFFSLYTFRYSFVADHYQYVASIGPIAVVAAALVVLGDRMKQAVRRGLSVFVLFVLAVLTWDQAHAYKDFEHLWRHTIRKNPVSWMAHNNLAALLNEQGRYDEARPFAEESLRLNPDSWTAQATMGHLLMHEGRPEESLPYFRRAIELRPDWATAYFDYGVALQSLNRYKEAADKYSKAVEISPNYADALLNLGVVLADLGRIDDSIAQFRRIIAERPDYPNVHGNLAMALYLKGDYAEAWSETRIAERNGDALNPAFMEALSRKMTNPRR